MNIRVNHTYEALRPLPVNYISYVSGPFLKGIRYYSPDNDVKISDINFLSIYRVSIVLNEMIKNKVIQYRL